LTERQKDTERDNRQTEMVDRKAERLRMQRYYLKIDIKTLLGKYYRRNKNKNRIGEITKLHKNKVRQKDRKTEKTKVQ